MRWQAVAAALKRGEALPVRDAKLAAPLQEALSDQADEIIGIVDRFALGAAAERSGPDADIRNPGETFFQQLDKLLDSFGLLDRGIIGRMESDWSDNRPKVFQSELWQVLHKVRESAELSYAREIDLVELDRRIVFMLRINGPMVPAGLSAAIGVDKAQVSRSVKRLLELKMVQRNQIRSPVSLSRKGEQIADRLLRLAELRNRELTFDINDKELSKYFGILDILLDRSISLYEREREAAKGTGIDDADSGIGPVIEPRKAGEPILVDRSRIVSPMLTLSAYFSRSGALIFKRTTGLSNFEAWVLSEISHDPPTDWSRLVAALERDHSQAGRTVNSLIERGLVERTGKPGRRHGRFSPTAEGKRLFDIIVATSEKRSRYLMEPLSDEELQEFLSTFNKIRRNAAAQLERERAYEELESD